MKLWGVRPLTRAAVVGVDADEGSVISWQASLPCVGLGEIRSLTIQRSIPRSTRGEPIPRTRSHDSHPRWNSAEPIPRVRPDVTESAVARDCKKRDPRS